MKRFYQGELENLRTQLLVMAERTVTNISDALAALHGGDIQLAERVIKSDDVIDELEVAIDAEASRYITLRSPVASDVRLLIVIMKVSHDLERMADESTSISKRVIRLMESRHMLEMGMLPELSLQAVDLVREVVECLVGDDSGKAESLPMRDKEIDQMHRRNFQFFTEKVQGSPELASDYIDLIFISKAIERICDHATNIAEEIVYLLRGMDIRHTEKTKRANV